MGKKPESFKKNPFPPGKICMGHDCESIKESFLYHLKHSRVKDRFASTIHDCYYSLALSIRDRLAEQWIETQQSYYENDAKRVYYMSLEFLTGRTLGNSLINLGLYSESFKAMHELGYSLEEFREIEWDAGLGNGGLGRLAACFMDSMATLGLPAYGYGIRYEYGIFFQDIKNGRQVEIPDNWLRYGNAWEIPRPERLYPVNFHGRVKLYNDADGNAKYEWVETEQIMAMAYDTPIPGYKNNTVNNMRLWSAKSSRDFNLDYFNHGDYEKAVADKSHSENISKVLYPNDNIVRGKELRLKQEYFFVTATLQDIIRRFKKTNKSFDNFPGQVAIQLNDTHPAIAIVELMRIFIDIEELNWEFAWDITSKTFAYTNHTILPEALEKWDVGLMEYVLPRHMQLIFEINRRFLDKVTIEYPDDINRTGRLSIIEEGETKKVRMANLAIVGSHSVNGVAALHSEIIKKNLFKDFFKLWPHKFNNKTNGITQRRWLKLCNPELSSLITTKIGENWTTDLFELKKLVPLADDLDFQNQWYNIKQQNKKYLSEYIMDRNRIKINLNSIFDIHIKRIHEYKRQLLNIMHTITMYNNIKENPKADFVPRTVIFAGKAAPGYYIAKLIIKLINSVADVINNDPDVGDKLKVVFIRNYAVSNAQKIIPAADLSEQISTAGTEASGTGNMKLALNGALTIGTLDGANIEIMEEVGNDNIFIFGLTADEVSSLRSGNYKPIEFYNKNQEIKKIIDMISNGFFSKGDSVIFKPIINSLLNRDHYMLLADYDSFKKRQEEVNLKYSDRKKWIKMSILNVANMGKFSTDRTIMEYSKDIWGLNPVPIKNIRKN